jgi:ubiquinone/menaquinone biosynthesis C-methylase UbiE
MNTSPGLAVNHHANQPNLGGLVTLLVGVITLIAGRDRARLPVELASVSDSDRVVDIGCGPGVSARIAANRGARVIGVDPARVMLRLARICTRGLPAVSWWRGAAEQLPVPNGWATVVWTIASVHHWRDVTAGLSDVRRVLASGGKFLVIETHVRFNASNLANHGWTDYQVQSFAAQCRTAGFDSVRIDHRPRGRYAVWVVQAERP